MCCAGRAAPFKPALEKLFVFPLDIRGGVEEELISCINDEVLMNISMEPVSFLVNSPLGSCETCLPRKGYFNLNSLRNLNLQI